MSYYSGDRIEHLPDMRDSRAIRDDHLKLAERVKALEDCCEQQRVLLDRLARALDRENLR